MTVAAVGELSQEKCAQAETRTFIKLGQRLSGEVKYPLTPREPPWGKSSVDGTVLLRHRSVVSRNAVLPSAIA